MIDEIDLEHAGEHLGVIFPTDTGPRYRMRVEIDLPRFLSLRGVYVPLGSCRVSPLFDYHEKLAMRETLPPMPDIIDEFDDRQINLITPWLEALDLEGILRPATLAEYDASLGSVKHDRVRRPSTDQWVPVTVRDTGDPAWEKNCAFPGWTNVLHQFAGMTGVLVHDTW